MRECSVSVGMNLCFKIKPKHFTTKLNKKTIKLNKKKTIKRDLQTLKKGTMERRRKKKEIGK